LRPAVEAVLYIFDLGDWAYHLFDQIIEILFRNLKCVLRIAHFVSTTENGIRLPIYAVLIHYVLTHLVILKAMQETGQSFERLFPPLLLGSRATSLATD
jgi:hypothetical protein